MAEDLKSKTRKAVISAVVIILWLLTGNMCQKDNSKDVELVKKLQNVSYVNSVSQVYSYNIAVPAVIEANQIIEIVSDRAGTISTINMKDGTRADKGALILSLDIEDKLSAKDSAAANLKKAEIELQSDKALFKQGYKSESEIANSEYAYNSAMQSYKAAEKSYEDSFIKMPFDGLMDEVIAEEGQNVDQSTVIARAIDLSKVIAYGQFSELDVSKIKIGSNADIDVLDGRRFKGKVTFISSYADPKTNTYKVGVEIDSDYQLRHGVSVSMTVQINVEDSHIIPSSALSLNSMGKAGVRALDDGSVVRFYQAEGIYNSQDRSIITGLPKKLKIIILGHNYVRSGETVNAQEAETMFLRDINFLHIRENSK